MNFLIIFIVQPELVDCDIIQPELVDCDPGRSQLILVEEVECDLCRSFYFHINSDINNALYY